MATIINTNSSGGSVTGSTTVVAGATITGFTVLSGGVLTVSGTDSATTIALGGAETVAGGGSVNSDIVYGTLTVSSGSSAANTTLVNGGTLILAKASATEAGTLSMSGTGDVLEITALASSGVTVSGMNATDSLLVSGVAATLTSFNSLTGAAVVELVSGTSSSSVTYTLEGATAASIVTLGSSEELLIDTTVISTGTVTGVVSGGYVLSNGGSVQDATIVSGGAVLVYGAGASDSGSTIAAGGLIYVSSGGTASDDKIYGTMVVSTTPSVLTSDTVYGGGVIQAGGNVQLDATTIAGGTVILESKSATLQDGVTFTGTGGIIEELGSPTSTTGDQAVISGFTAGDEIIAAATAGSTLSLVAAGGVTEVEIVSGGTVTETWSFASDTLVTYQGVNLSGYETISVAPTTTLTGSVTGGSVLAGLTVNVAAGASLTGASVLAGGLLEVSGSEIDGTIASGGSAIILGTASGEVISGGESISGSETGATIALGGTETVTGTAGGDLILGTEIVSGTLAGATIAGGTLVLAAGASLAGTLSFGNGGTLVETGSIAGTQSIADFTGADTISLSDLGTGVTLTSATSGADAVITLAGGSLMDASETFTFTGDAGSLISIATLGGSAVLTLSNPLTIVSAGQTETGLSLAAGHVLEVQAGGTIAGASIAQGATASLAGTDNGSTIAGYETITASGSASGDELSGTQAVSGSIANETVATGGAILLAGGSSAGTITLSGGTLDASTGTLSGTLYFAAGGTLLLSDSVANSAVISGFSGTDVIDLASVGSGAILTGRETIDGDTVVTLSGGSGMGTLTEVLTFAGTGDIYQLGTDGAGGETLTAIPIITSFTAGDIVFGAVGDVDDSGDYGDNQAAPIALEEIDPSTGKIVGIMILPQETSVVNGTLESMISGEYGSSSEGILEDSANGEQLVIAGYGVNADVYNTAEAAGGVNNYGTAALAQTTSLTDSTLTPVARVVADISYDGTIDTSTTVYNIYNTNNPRSVATVDGTSFYLSGQGAKDDTQGVFYVTDGSSAATAIDTSTDTRDIEIYNGTLYVSQNSSEGTSNIEAFTGLPTSSSTPTILANIDTAVTLTAAAANAVNGAEIGQLVNLSPEQYFFANATTLYVADSGNPKAGGLGDGGLQKWVLDTATGKWNLVYTISDGLNLVADTGASGTTGLIGLTAVENADGTVTFYVTNATIGDLDQTYVYTITDEVSATTLSSSESFTVVTTAQTDSNDRGIALAPEAETSLTIASGVTSAGLQEIYGDTVTVSAGGTMSAAVLSAGAAAYVAGTDSGSLIELGATETVYGTAIADNVYGDQLVSGSVADETIHYDGAVTIATGGTATDFTLQTGAELIDEGSAAGVLISGGLVALEASDASLSGVTFAGAGAVALLGGLGSVSGVISGFAAGDALDLTGIGTTASLSSLVSGGDTTLTVTAGTLTESFTLAGGYADLTLTADAAGGEEITLGASLASGTDEVTAGEYGADFTIASGATLLVDGGATVTGDLIAGVATIAGTSSDDVITGALTLASGALASAETLSGGTLDIAAGASLTGTLSLAGDATIVLASGASLGAVVSGFEYGDDILFTGLSAGTLTSATVAGNEVLTITSGSTIETVTLAGTAYAANDFTFANGTLTAETGVLDVTSGELGENLTIAAHFALDVASGGTIIATSLLSGGTATILGTDSATTIAAGATLTISSGGVEQASTIALGGTELLVGAATAGGDLVYGLQLDSATTGALLSNETIGNGGTVAFLYKTNTLAASTILSGGDFVVSANATGTDLVLQGGTIMLESAKSNLQGTLAFATTGTLIETTVISAGYGDEAVITGFGAGDAIALTAFTTGATLISTQSGGLYIETVSGSAGSESFTFAGTSEFALQSLASGGYELISEASVVTSGVTGASVASGGELVITAGGSLSGGTVASGGTLVVAGGSESGGTISGGAEIVSSGGTASGTTITDGGSQTVTNGGTVTGVTLTSDSTQILTSGGTAFDTTVGDPSVQTVSAGATATNTTLVDGGEQNVYGTAIDTTIDSGSEQLVYTGGTSTDVLVNAGGTLALEGGTVADVTLAGGAVLDIGTLAYSATDTATIVGNELEISSDGTLLFSATLDGTYDYATISLSADGASGTDATLTLCFYPGTRIATPSGEIAVEDLREGDLVTTPEGAQPVRWIGQSHIHTRFADPLRSLPVRVAAGALGEGLPARDLLLSPDHALFLDGLLIQAGALAGQPGITREHNVPARFTYYHVELPAHTLLLAEGALAESFVDNVDRLHFANWDARAAALAPLAEMPHPRVKSARQLPRLLAARLAPSAA